LKRALVAEAKPALVAESAYPLPVVPTVRLLKVAMPFTGMTLSLPPKLTVLPTRLSITGLLVEETMLPLASSTATVTAGEITACVDAFEGCCRNASWVAVAVVPAGAVTLKRALVVEAKPALVAESAYPVPAVPMVRLLKVAMPLMGTTLSVPPKFAVLPARLSFTGLLADETMLPLASSIATVTAGEITVCVDAFEGCCRKASFVPVVVFVIVRVEEATELCDIPNTATACTVDVIPIESAPEYCVEELVGTAPSIV
jgi:hypothetical protein